jgi:hypothetical protein
VPASSDVSSCRGAELTKRAIFTFTQVVGKSLASAFCHVYRRKRRHPIMGRLNPAVSFERLNSLYTKFRSVDPSRMFCRFEPPFVLHVSSSLVN